jgi:large subunit ribosomal protein L29
MSEYRGKTEEQLQLDLRELERHLFQLRFQSATDRLETPSEIRKARREIARIKTLQRERELVKNPKPVPIPETPVAKKKGTK